MERERDRKTFNYSRPCVCQPRPSYTLVVQEKASVCVCCCVFCGSSWGIFVYNAAALFPPSPALSCFTFVHPLSLISIKRAHFVSLFLEKRWRWRDDGAREIPPNNF